MFICVATFIFFKAIHLIQDDADRTGNDEFFDRQLSQNEFSPQVFEFPQQEISNDTVMKTEILQGMYHYSICCVQRRLVTIFIECWLN